MQANAQPIYLDNQATTPVDPRVLDAMLPYFTKIFGNSASKTHVYGNEALQAVEISRNQIAKAINAKDQEIIFTSGATEAINLAIKGLAFRENLEKPHIITIATEHKAVLDCFDRLHEAGVDTTILPVDANGMLNLEHLQQALRSETRLVCAMAANNEIGVLHPLCEIGALCRAKGIFFMTDATQALGKIPIDVQRMKIDLLAGSAHKLYGPKGIGFLYARRSNPRVPIRAMIDGGGHEHGMRSGTLATPNIVGFARAVELARTEMSSEEKRVRKLRDRLERLLLEGIPSARVNGHPISRISNNLNIELPGVPSEALMIAVKESVAISSGSACTTAALLPSHVLEALGRNAEQIHSSIRFGIGRFTKPEEIELAGEVVIQQHTRLRAFQRRPIAQS